MSQNGSQTIVPQNTDIPFFTYGIFKPGQLGYFRLRDLVQRFEQDCFIRGTLLERDGLPIIDQVGEGEVRGCLLYFKPENARQAYEKVAEIEPGKQYRWDEAEVAVRNTTCKANALYGRSPRRGSVEFEGLEWDGSRDPLFTDALNVVRETLRQNSILRSQMDLRPFFRLQMAYLLLWSAIERYVSLRYHLGRDVEEKIKHLDEESAFKNSLKDVASSREVVRADKPSEKVRLDPSSPTKSRKYYYQVRSNVTHRGKSVWQDFDLLKTSLEELLQIFNALLKAAFESVEAT